MIDGEREEHAYRVETNDSRERLNIVNVIRLGKATSDQTRLVTYNGTIRMIFEGEDPLAPDNFSIYRMGNQSLSPARNQGPYL